MHEKSLRINAGLQFFIEVSSLFAYYFKFNFGAVAIAEIDISFISSQFFYFVSNMNLFAVDFISFLFADGAANL